jgi:diguanylate cyclase (GGDEF)-like protein
MQNHNAAQPQRQRHGATLLLLGSDRQQRLRLQRSLLASGVCLVAMAVLGWGVAVGFVERSAGGSLIAVLGIGLLLFYVVLRSGANLHLHDPSMTLPQMAFAVSGMTAAYAVSGPVRGGFLVLIACAMVFGAFAPRRSQTRKACALTLLLLAVVMALMAWLDPQLYDPRVEATHFLLCAVALPSIAAVAGQLRDVRERLRSRNRDLATALERIHALATRDELTGLANRRHMRECLDAEWRQLGRRQTATCLCLIDLDHFKQINDRHGHAAGDLVLKEFAGVAVQSVRQGDVFARWGGEEFLWLLPGSALADAGSAIHRLRRAFDDAPAWQHRPELKTTFSAGLSQMHADEPLANAMERADAALYLAKTTGRDATQHVARR